jgi:hypothetical protein
MSINLHTNKLNYYLITIAMFPPNIDPCNLNHSLANDNTINS